jgi:Spy/CpxP family protein refolding chaperone
MGPGMGAQMGPGFGGGLLGGMMAAALDITDAQKEQIRAIQQSNREANRAVTEQLRPIREQEREAVKSGASEAALRSLANSAAPLMAQMHANNLVAQSKTLQVLTPEQREKLDKLRGQARGRAGTQMKQRRSKAQ